MRNLLLVTAVFIFFSCSKNGTDLNNISPDDITGSWRVSGMTSDRAIDWDNNGTTETNIYATWDACQRDNAITFGAGGTGFTRASCNSSTYNLSWYLSGNQLSYTIAGNPNTNLTITSLGNNYMTAHNTLYYGNQPIVITTTFTRQ